MARMKHEREINMKGGPITPTPSDQGRMRIRLIASFEERRRISPRNHGQNFSLAWKNHPFRVSSPSEWRFACVSRLSNTSTPCRLVSPIFPTSVPLHGYLPHSHPSVEVRIGWLLCSHPLSHSLSHSPPHRVSPPHIFGGAPIGGGDR